MLTLLIRRSRLSRLLGALCITLVMLFLGCQQSSSPNGTRTAQSDDQADGGDQDDNNDNDNDDGDDVDGGQSDDPDDGDHDGDYRR